MALVVINLMDLDSYLFKLDYSFIIILISS